MFMRRPLSALVCAVTFAAASAHAQTVSAVMHVGLRSVDPTITTAYIVRNYAYMVYDTLLARDAKGEIKPQMVDKWIVSADGKTYTFTLRDGLKWHDGTAVTSADCIASIKRWSSLDKLGQMMASMLSEMTAVDQKTFTLVFKEPTDIGLRALSKGSGVPLFAMPSRVAQTPPGEPIKDTIGSGPFKFVANEYRPGVQAVFEKNKDYVPRNEPASGMAGGKQVKVDRVKWVTMPDMMTAVNALNGGEIDFIEHLPQDLMPMLESNADVVLQASKIQGAQNIARVNTTQPPFNNKLLRQAAMLAIDQKAVLQAQIGNPKYYNLSGAMLGSVSPLTSTTDADKVIKPDLARAKQLLKDAKYDGTPVVLLHPTDNPTLTPMPPVIAQALRQAGFTVQVQAMDWQTVVNRRTSKEPVDKGGWSMFATQNNVAEIGDPVGSITIAANGANGWFGWPDVPRVEELRGKLARTTDLAEQKKLAEELQKVMVDEAYSLILGEFSIVTAKRKGLQGQIDAAVPVFWNMTKSGK